MVFSISYSLLSVFFLHSLTKMRFFFGFCAYFDELIQTPLPEQEEITDGVPLDLEHLGTKELAYHITQFDWDLFWSIHEYELLYHTFGRHHFGKVSVKCQ